MSGPKHQATNAVIIPPGEGRRIFSPSALAWFVENLEIDEHDTVKSIVGPSILRIKEEHKIDEKPSLSLSAPDLVDSGLLDLSVVDYKTSGVVPKYFKTARPHSIFYAQLLNGSADTLYYRFGDKIYRFRGESGEEDEVIVSGLSSKISPRFPDQYVVINNQVIFTNGIDHAKIISYDGSVDPLGYTQRPSTPMLSGPSQPEAEEADNYYPNSLGYSFPGRIGTPGDTLTGRKGSLLDGQWYYYFQFEDRHGNLSEFSYRSESVSTKAAQAYPYEAISLSDGSVRSLEKYEDQNINYLQPDGSEIDDLTRRFLVSFSGKAPEHTTAIRIFRTPDTRHRDNTPRFVARVPGTKAFMYDDNKSDSELSSEWVETVSVPVFRIMCSHQGRLIIGNIEGEPGMVRRSEPGFPGTFLEDDYIYPDSGGAEITGLVSHNGALIAFTEHSMFAIGDDFTTPQPISLGIGCSAPQTITALKDGTLVWLSRDGFYGMKQFGSITRLSAPIDKIFKSDVNKGRINLASAVVDPSTGEYRCVLSEKGSSYNNLIFCFDGKYWRRQTLQIHLSYMCVSTDTFRHVFAIGSDYIRERGVEVSYKDPQDKNNRTDSTDLHRVFVLDHQTTDWYAPPRRIRYRSNWIYSSKYGLTPTNIRTLYIGLKDAWDGLATVRIFKNGGHEPVHTMSNLKLVGTDDESNVVADVANKARLNIARYHEPRLFWRQIPVNLENVTSWAFEIELLGFVAPYPNAQVVTYTDVADPDSKLDFPPVSDGDLEAIARLYPSDVIQQFRLALAYKDDASVALSLDPTASDGLLDSLISLVYPDTIDSRLRNLPEFAKLLESIRDGSSSTPSAEGVYAVPYWPELGRMRLAAFAFDASVASLGTPLGRVPYREDE